MRKSVSMTSTAYHKEHKITLIIDLSIELNISQFDNACAIVRNISYQDTVLRTI